MKSVKKKVSIDENFVIGDGAFTLFGGPCSLESEEMALNVASTVKEICDKYNIQYVFKSSFDKANRSSLNTSRAIGMDKGLQVLEKINRTLGIPTTTDVHETQQCAEVGAVVDILQIPAYLSRQTDLILSAAKTGRVVSIKKGQFMAPWNIGKVVEKVETLADSKCIIIERGSTFGYNRLVVDMTGLPIMREYECPVFIDATHSVQEPEGKGAFTKGDRKAAESIMYAALAVGVDGVFAEIHPDPDNALSDVGSQLKLSEIEPILHRALEFNKLAWRR